MQVQPAHMAALSGNRQVKVRAAGIAGDLPCLRKGADEGKRALRGLKAHGGGDPERFAGCVFLKWLTKSLRRFADAAYPPNARTAPTTCARRD